MGELTRPMEEAHGRYMDAGWEWQDASVRWLEAETKKRHPDAAYIVVTAILEHDYTEHSIAVHARNGSIINPDLMDDLDETEAMLATEGACFAGDVIQTIFV